MFAQAGHFATAPLRFVNADIPSCEYVDARASRTLRKRQIEPLIAPPDAQKPSWLWEVNETDGESRRSPDASRAARARSCRGDEK
jgi:hypothetical protein